MKDKKQLFVSVVLNAFIVLFSIIGLILKFDESKVDYCFTFSFYTYILTIIINFIYLFQKVRYIKKEEEVSKNIEYNKYIVTTMQTLIMIYWVVFVAPLAGNDFLAEFLFKGGSLFLHVLCPIISIITLLCYDDLVIKKKDSLTALIPTVCYGALIIILNLIHALIGPYGFFEVYYSPFDVIILTPVVLLLIELVISFILYLCNNAAVKVKKANH